MPVERLTVLRAIDKLDRLGADGVGALLGNGRKDESGDFTKGAGLTDEQIATIAIDQVSWTWSLVQSHLAIEID